MGITQLLDSLRKPVLGMPRSSINTNVVNVINTITDSEEALKYIVYLEFDKDTEAYVLEYDALEVTQETGYLEGLIDSNIRILFCGHEVFTLDDIASLRLLALIIS